jgi:hypothetical protein
MALEAFVTALLQSWATEHVSVRALMKGRSDQVVDPSSQVRSRGVRPGC